jgi:hypothetical protein
MSTTRTTACPYCERRGVLTIGPEREVGWGDHWRPATIAERIRCDTCGSVNPDDVPAELLDVSAPSTAHLSSRISSTADVGPVLAAVLVAAERDERLTSSALAVLRVLHAAAIERGWIETTAARWWLAREAQLTTGSAQRALGRLVKLGYVDIIRPGDVRSKALQRWLRERETGRPPLLVRLATEAPMREESPDQNPAQNPAHRE